MTNVPTVSAVIPTYNRGHLLKNAIDSILAQTYPVHEIIIVDDGSTDGTGKMIHSYMRQRHTTPGQIRYFYQENQGQAVARNRALESAIGEWIAFLDADDVWLPKKLECQFRTMEHFDWQCGACFTDAQFVNNPHMQTTAFQLAGKRCDQRLGIVSDPIRSVVESALGAWISTFVVRTGLLGRTGGFDPKLDFVEDRDFTFRVARVTDFCFVNSPLACIDRTPTRHDGSSKVWDQVDFRLRIEQHLYEKWLNLSGELPSDVLTAIRDNLRDIHSAWTNFYCEREEYERARQEISTAAQYGLTYKLAIKWVLAQIAPKLARKVVSKYARRYHPEHF